jgi:hypothetical protein
MSLDKYFDNNDFVPFGNIGNPLSSEGVFN